MRLATRLPGERNLAKEDADRIAEIRREIMEVGDRWRSRHPKIARNQDLVGLMIFLVSTVMIVVDGFLYAAGLLPWWAVVLMTAFWLSILHEVEHDLIHSMYFRRRAVVHNLMMFGVWFFRPSSINPWVRRRLHLHHHEVSGTDSDLEERAITNGEGWGVHRLVSLSDSLIGIYTKPLRMRGLVAAYVKQVARDREEARRLITMNKLAYFPLGAIHYGLWHVVIGLHIAQYFAPELANSPVYQGLNFLAVVILIPNAVRTFCLHFVSSNMHYYGDIEAHNVLQQTQVWTAKRMWIFHTLCFNFGETHAIHHFLVRDPFYIREATKRECQGILRRHGVRFNDFGTFRRANRFAVAAPGEA